MPSRILSASARASVFPTASPLIPQAPAPDEKTLHVRPLIVDDKVKEWTTGEVHDITDRSFVVRRALRLNDALPGDKTEHWIWQRGPWIMIDRSNGHVTAMKLPDYDPSVSQVIWFRDYAAYCGLNSGGHQLYAVVAQVGARRPILAKKIGPWTPTPPTAGTAPAPACAKATWQRDPLRVSFAPTGVSRADELQPRRSLRSPGRRRRYGRGKRKRGLRQQLASRSFLATQGEYDIDLSFTAKGFPFSITVYEPTVRLRQEQQ